MIFRDRTDAGKRLAKRLKKEKYNNPLVIALPKGGVPVALPISKELHAPLYILPVRKIGHPDNPELAVGAITLDSEMIPSENHIIEKIAQQERSNLKKYYEKFNRLPPNDLTHYDVMLVDDGIATGTTSLVAIASIRQKNPHSLTIATPVCATTAVETLKSEVDIWMCLEESDLGSVSSAYHEFEQVEDKDVIHLLSQAEDESQKVS